jgi:hypothetical protein
LRVDSLGIGLVDARALLAHCKCKRRGLVEAVANVNKGLSRGIEDLSTVASLIRHLVGIADGCLQVVNYRSVLAARALLIGSVCGSSQNA